MVYDVAFALVWADDGEDVTTRNEAYAFASCADCAAVAVGFQVVLIVGQTDVMVPENLSAAANYNCVRCLTYALANQLVLTLDGPLSADGMSRLNELWQQIAEYGRNLQNVPLSEIQGRLDAFKAQIMEVIRSDPSATPGGSRRHGSRHDGQLAGTRPDCDPRSPRRRPGHAAPSRAHAAHRCPRPPRRRPRPRRTGPAGPQPTQSAGTATAPAPVTPSPVPTATAPPAP